MSRLIWPDTQTDYAAPVFFSLKEALPMTWTFLIRFLSLLTCLGVLVGCTASRGTQQASIPVDPTSAPAAESGSKINGESLLPAPVPTIPAESAANGTGVADELRTGVQAIAVGNRHSCALLNGEVQCWGRNDYGDRATVRPWIATRR